MKAKDNPFATERIESFRYRFLDGDWDLLLKRLWQLGNRGAIVGPEGSGKTLLLEQLAGRLRAKGYQTRLLLVGQDGRSCLEGLQCCSEEFLLLDGAEELNIFSLSLLKRRSQNAAGLVLTAHKVNRLFPTLFECFTNLDLFLELLEDLLGTNKQFSKHTLEQVYQKYQGNIRLAFLELYDRVQDPSLL